MKTKLEFNEERIARKRREFRLTVLLLSLTVGVVGTVLCAFVTALLMGY